MLLFTKLAAPKAPKRRSRAGCTSCKEKKKKCDEERPKCARCAERGGACVYEPVRPRQRRKRDYIVSSSTPSTTTDESGGSGSSGSSAGPGARLGNGGANTANGAAGIRPLQIPSRPGMVRGEYGDGYDDEDCGMGIDNYPRRQTWATAADNSYSSWRHGPAHLDFDEGGSSDEAGDMAIFSPLEDSFGFGPLVPRHSAGNIGEVVMSPVVDKSGAYDDEVDEAEPVVRSIGMEQQLDRRSSFASSTTTTAAVVVAPRHTRLPTPEDLAQHQHQHQHQQRQRQSGHGFSPDLAMIAPSPVRSPLLEFCAPAFSEFSDRPGRRLLVDHFCNVLSHLIVFREESGNPFQQLVLPLMATGSSSPAGSPVADAVYALASAHREHRGLDAGGGERSLYYHQRAIQGLSKLIQPTNGKVDKNQVLAAIILLVYYEVLVQRSRSNIIEGHLKGALTVMCSDKEPLDSTGIFLERAFRFYDVIAALSFGSAPLSTAPAAGCLLPFPPLGAPAASPLNNVDTLLGMSTTLWPIIHRLSSLLALRSDLDAARADGHPAKVAVLRTEFETTASSVEAALLGWTPCPPTGWVLDTEVGGDPTKLRRVPTGPVGAGDDGQPGSDGALGAGVDGGVAVENPNGDGSSTSRFGADIDSDIAASQRPVPGGPTPSPATPSAATDSERLHSILNNSLAYRHAALVHLYRTVHSRPRRHPLVQRHTRLALRHCAATVGHGGPMGALLWPLFAAACEAVDPADRALADLAFSAIDQRQGMTNIERAWEIVKEVWRRADLSRAAAPSGRDDGEVEGGEEDLEGEDHGEGDLDDDDDDGDVMDYGGFGAGRRHSHGHGHCEATRRPSSRRMSDFTNPSRRNGIDMWRKVSEDMGVSVVFG